MDTQLIYEYAKNPINFGHLADADLIHKETNHICGEEMTIYLKFKKGDIIEKISFEADGRMVTLAAASLLTEEMLHHHLAEIENINSKDILDMLELEENSLTPKRLKSATLCLLALKNAHRILQKKPLLGYEDILN